MCDQSSEFLFFRKRNRKHFTSVLPTQPELSRFWTLDASNSSRHRITENPRNRLQWYLNVAIRLEKSKNTDNPLYVKSMWTNYVYSVSKVAFFHCFSTPSVRYLTVDDREFGGRTDVAWKIRIRRDNSTTRSSGKSSKYWPGKLTYWRTK